MNLINCVIRILELPKIRLYHNKIPYTRFNIELAQARKTEIISIIKAESYGDLVYDLENYLNVNDYLIIEGYFSVFDYSSNQIMKRKGLIFHIIKFYPFITKNLTH